jgi:hypothetical protein
MLGCSNSSVPHVSRRHCFEAPRSFLWHWQMQTLAQDEEPRASGVQQGEGLPSVAQAAQISIELCSLGAAECVAFLDRASHVRHGDGVKLYRLAVYVSVMHRVLPKFFAVNDLCLASGE